MSDPKAFILPLRGLGQGSYAFDFIVDDEFYANFEDAPIERCDVKVHLDLDKQSRGMTLNFRLAGTVGTDCDRCLAPIDLPVEDSSQLIVKFDAEADERRDDEGDIIYLHPETNDFDLAPYVYELVVLALPMIRTYDCREGSPPYPCDEDMLDRIDASFASADEIDESVPNSAPGVSENGKPSPWDVLKNLRTNDGGETTTN